MYIYPETRFLTVLFNWHRVFKPFIFLQLVFSVLFVSSMVSAAPLPDKIRVAIATSNIPYHFIDEKGKPSGLAVDMWLEWQKHTGVEVEFVANNWPGTIEDVKTGKADIHVGLAQSPSRSEFLAFGEKIYSVSSNVYIHKNIVGVSNFQQLTPYVIGAIRSAAHNEDLMKFNANIRYKFYDSRKELLAGIESNEINAFVELDYRSFQFHGFERIAEDYPIYKSLMLTDSDLLLAVAKRNSNWLPAINEGFNKIPSQKVAELEGLWFRSGSNPSALRIAISAGNEPFMSVNLAGEPTGLFVELWQKWAEKNDIEIEFVPNSMQLSLQSLQSGKADVHIAYPESESVNTGLPHAKHLYSVYSKLFLPEDYDVKKALEQLTGKTIGLFYTAPYKMEFEQNFPQLKVAWFKSSEEMINAAVKGDIYGFIAEQHTMSFRLLQNNLNERFVTIPDISYESKLFSLVKDNFGLIEKINEGFTRLSIAELEAIEAKWLGQEHANYFKNNIFRLGLSAEQKNWLQQVPEIKVGIKDNWKPYEFVDEFGNVQGITKDVFDIAQQLTGQKYNFEVYSSWESLLNDFKTGHLDMVANISKSEQRESYASFTEPFWQSSWAVATQKDLGKFDSIKGLFGKRIALVEGYQILNEVHEKYPQVIVQVVSSLDEAIELLHEEQVDGILENMVVLSQFLQDREEVNFKLHILQDMTADTSRMGVRKDLIVQFEIMEKVVAAITDVQSKAILNKWFKLDLDSGVSYQTYWRNITIALVFGSLIVAIVLFWNRKLKKEIQLRKKAERLLKHLATHDALTELPNRSLLNDILKRTIANHSRTQQKMAVMFVDLDGFKEVNDNFGHAYGDELLMLVGQRLAGNLRASDTVARIGGDEFVLLVTNLDEYRQCEKVAAKVIADLEQSFSLKIGPVNISASIGIACYPINGKTNDELLKVADDLMYEVKRDGKRGYQFAKNLVL